MKNLELVLSQPVFLFDFCFKSIDFLATQFAHFDACLFILYAIITVFESKLSVTFLFTTLKNKFSGFYNRSIHKLLKNWDSMNLFYLKIW